MSLRMCLNGLELKDHSHRAGNSSPPQWRASLRVPAFHPSFFKHCLAQASESCSLKLSFEKRLPQNFCLPSDTTLWGAITSHSALQRKSISSTCNGVSGTSLPVPTGTGYTGISYCESVPKTRTSSPYVQKNQNVAQCIHRQKNLIAAGLAGAKSPPTPVFCLQE